MVEIPCAPNGQSRWTQRTALGGRDYVLTFDWNQRMGAWMLAVADQDGAAIAAGLRLAPGLLLLRGVTDARRPPGELCLLDARETEGREPEDPTFTSLGARHVLAYLDAADLAAVGA